jgi:hypothetical protein
MAGGEIADVRGRLVSLVACPLRARSGIHHRRRRSLWQGPASRNRAWAQAGAATVTPPSRCPDSRCLITSMGLVGGCRQAEHSYLAWTRRRSYPPLVRIEGSGPAGHHPARSRCSAQCEERPVDLGIVESTSGTRIDPRAALGVCDLPLLPPVKCPSAGNAFRGPSVTHS